MKNTIFYLFLVGILFSCQSHPSSEFNLGYYQLKLPTGFTVQDEEGIDAYVGKIVSKDVVLSFEYGIYSNPLIPSREEYFQDGDWKPLPYILSLDTGIVFRREDLPLIDVVNIHPHTPSDSSTYSDADYLATCKRETEEFLYPIYLPEEIKAHEIIMDTLAGFIRKMVIAKDPLNGCTGLYIRPYHFEDTTKSYPLKLCVYTHDISKAQQDSLVRMFNNMMINEKPLEETKVAIKGKLYF